MKKKIHDCKKCKVQEITILKIGGEKFISTFELYRVSKMEDSNYTRWLTNTVLPLGCLMRDYVPAPENKQPKKKGSRKRLRYYLTIDFAISISLLMRRKKSIEVRNYLIQQR